MSLDIKGSTITGDDARAEIVDKILTKQDLTTKELEFVKQMYGAAAQAAAGAV
jgi:hypothetical protein